MLNREGGVVSRDPVAEIFSQPVNTEHDVVLLEVGAGVAVPPTLESSTSVIPFIVAAPLAASVVSGLGSLIGITSSLANNLVGSGRRVVNHVGARPDQLPLGREDAFRSEPHDRDDQQADREQSQRCRADGERGDIADGSRR